MPWPVVFDPRSAPLPTETIETLRLGTRSEPHRVSEVFRIVPTAYVPQKAREAPRTGFDGRGRVSAMGFREGGPTPSYLRSLNVWTVNRCSYESKEVWMARKRIQLLYGWPPWGVPEAPRPGSGPPGPNIPVLAASSDDIASPFRGSCDGSERSGARAVRTLPDLVRGRGARA